MISSLSNEKIRYLIAGAWNTVFGFVFFSVFFSIFENKVNHLILTAITHEFAIINAFLTLKFFVFKPSHQSAIKELVKFHGVHLAGGTICLLLVFILVDLLHFNTLPSVLSAQIAVIAFGFMAHKKYSFSQLKPKKKQKTAFITGGSNGIGLALVKQYLQEGYVIGIADKELPPADLSNNANIIYFNLDVKNREHLVLAAATLISKFGSIDLVIANAGVCQPDQLTDSDEDQAAQNANMSINYYGAINTIIPFMDAFKRQGYGAIAISSSISSWRSTHNSGAYSASKSAINSWAESLRIQLAEHNVTVTTFIIGFVKTRMTKELPFRTPGMVSAELVAKKMVRAIASGRHTFFLPKRQYPLWGFLKFLPDTLYIALIRVAKENTFVTRKKSK